MGNFIANWNKFLQACGMTELYDNGAIFPDTYGIDEREDVYMQFALRSRTVHPDILSSLLP